MHVEPWVVRGCRRWSPMQAPPLGGSGLGRGIKESRACLRACVVRVCVWAASTCTGLLRCRDHAPSAFD